MRVLGIDPGSAATGWGMVELAGGALRHRGHGVVRTPPGGAARRLASLARALSELVERERPEVAAVEQIFVARSPRSALVLGQARGVILAVAALAGVPVVEYAPAEVKRAVTGSGRAGKPQVQWMVEALLSLPRRPARDAADALAVAICHARAGRLRAIGAAGGSRRSLRDVAVALHRRGSGR